ncbi:hypothetical protein ANN_03222 [Periplaneta americana]|uniref:CCHC-type domain-containing protein n=1 Tax=Periplaneta americana TaxID=6978 RepID=A0ABQ8TYD9_PERAM|nr:hypothetical protein ANN_03222 [Periplaneta americana]
MPFVLNAKKPRTCKKPHFACETCDIHFNKTPPVRHATCFTIIKHTPNDVRRSAKSAMASKICRKNTIKAVFNKDQQRPTAYEIHQWLEENINVREDELDTLQLVSKQNAVYIKFNNQLSYEKHLQLHTGTSTIQLMNGATTTVNLTAGQEQTCFLCGSASHIRRYCPGKGSRQIGNNNNRPFLMSDLKPIRDLPDENHPSTVLPISEEATTSASSRTIEPNTREDGQGGQEFTRENGTSTETTTRPTMLLGQDPLQDDIENNLVEIEDSDTITADEDETKEPGKKRRKKNPELDQVKNDGQSTNIEKNKILGNSSQLDSHIKDDGNQVKLTKGSSNQSNAITSIQESRTRMEGDNWSDEIEMEGKTMESEVDMNDSRTETHGSKKLTKDTACRLPTEHSLSTVKLVYPSMSLDLINTEDFISEIESRPAIWDVKSDNYSNKVVKTNAWQEIIAKFVPDFNEKKEQRLRVFENKVLRKIFGAKRDEVTGEWRKLHNAELHALYSSPDIIRNIKSICLRWAGHVAVMGESRNAYRVLVGRPEGKRSLGRPRRRWEDNIKMDLREVGYGDRDWINLAQDRDQWRAYVNGNEPPGSLNAIFQSNHQLRIDVYTFPELADMVMCYGEARGNGRRALHMYQQQFQNRNHSQHTMFARLYQRLRDDGSLRSRRIGGRPRRHPFSVNDNTELKGKELPYNPLGKYVVINIAEIFGFLLHEAAHSPSGIAQRRVVDCRTKHVSSV